MTEDLFPFPDTGQETFADIRLYINPKQLSQLDEVFRKQLEPELCYDDNDRSIAYLEFPIALREAPESFPRLPDELICEVVVPEMYLLTMVTPGVYHLQGSTERDRATLVVAANTDPSDEAAYALLQRIASERGTKIELMAELLKLVEAGVIEPIREIVWRRIRQHR